MIWAIIAGIYIGLSFICTLVFWAACVAGARADRRVWRHDLEAQWPSMPDVEGIDLFLEQYGSPTGRDNES